MGEVIIQMISIYYSGMHLEINSTQIKARLMNCY